MGWFGPKYTIKRRKSSNFATSGTRLGKFIPTCFSSILTATAKSCIISLTMTSVTVRSVPITIFKTISLEYYQKFIRIIKKVNQKNISGDSWNLTHRSRGWAEAIWKDKNMAKKMDINKNFIFEGKLNILVLWNLKFFGKFDWKLKIFIPYLFFYTENISIFAITWWKILMLILFYRSIFLISMRSFAYITSDYIYNDDH